jgi:phosphoribosylaminoimidazole-succinocarboxamide synthase
VKRILRTSCWIDFHTQPQLEVVVRDAGAGTHCVRLTFDNGEQITELIEKLRHLADAMLREKILP